MLVLAADNQDVNMREVRGGEVVEEERGREDDDGDDGFVRFIFCLMRPSARPPARDRKRRPQKAATDFTSSAALLRGACAWVDV